ncbi:MAG TPA: AgmX/PglI C-terminal domain-containing protein [Kofleriaceae bacterium]|nr:AgmX/PglI C-terminal domain-containing protein [Kofleriaceae bacterium]
MLRTAILVVAVLLPAIAHAEFATPRDTGDVRPAATIKRTKVERSPSRVALVTTPRLTVDEVLTKINTIYMSGLQRCYRKSLAADPSLSGKVVLAFQVDADGHALSDITGGRKFDECLSHIVAHWRFSPPANQNDASFRISLALQNN